MLTLLQKFLVDEDGAVTVDWVVLTAGIVMFGALVVGTIQRGATDTSSSLGANLTAAFVPVVVFE